MMRTSLILRVCALLLCALLLLPIFSSCAASEERSEKFEIVCTIYPIYDLVCAVLGDRVSDYPVLLLSDNGNDPHNYQPSVKDIASISDASVFFYVGGASDAWAEELSRPAKASVSLLDACDVCEGDHDHAHGEGEHHDHGAYDEHFWMSLSNASAVVEEILRVLSEVYRDDSDAVTDFCANADAYKAELSALDARYRDMVADAALDTIIVADRFPFLYLVRDYGLSYHAAFPGCSAECDASFSTVVGLSDRLRASEISALIVTETGERELAETVIRTSGRDGIEILTLHSCQRVTKEDREAGVTYLTIMENNLSVLTRALTP